MNQSLLEMSNRTLHHGVAQIGFLVYILRRWA